VLAGRLTGPETLPESARLAGYLSFNLDLTEARLDGERLSPGPHQDVVATGTDRYLVAEPTKAVHSSQPR
jgi:hypothetical protein